MFLPCMRQRLYSWRKRADSPTQIITSLPAANTGRLVFRCITCGIHGFGFVDVPPSCLEQCRRAVLLLVLTHQTSSLIIPRILLKDTAL